jgi:predicted Ser/Thr protein kinase
MADDSIDRIGRSVAERYEADRRLLSFGQLLDRFREDPYVLSRSAVQYLRDAIRHFGRAEVRGIGGDVPRWRIFDDPANCGEGAVVGQEAAQRAIVEVVEGAANDGRLDRMIVLHGPNGSGKSSLIELLLCGLEQYSHTPGGALYALRWIFPKAPPESAGLGFGGTRREDDRETYANLTADEVAGRVVCEMRCNPLFVVPDSERPRLLEEALGAHPERRSESYRRLLRGNLCPKCKTIYEGLLAANRGDWRRVVRHVQVERIFVSRRFRVGAVVTQPQGTPDAGLVPLSGSGLGAGLPAFVHAAPLHEVVGDLPDANRGLLEFSDFLKRNLELSKYLLHTTERGFVTVGNLLLELDIVFLATVNERHLEAFRQMPEFPSFQGRMHFVRVPYLREIDKEERIYERLCRELARGGHVAPHVPRILAFFAVLTRLERPRRESFEGRARALVHDLTPREKLWLYAEGRTPERLDADDARETRAAIPRIRDEHERESQYEGRVGASVRDMRAWLVRASVRRDVGCLAPSIVVDALRELIQQKETYRFLQAEADGEYHDAEALLRGTVEELGDLILHDVQEAMQVVTEEEYGRRFDTYVQHAIAHVRGESVRDPSTGRAVPPDEGLMQSVEKLLPPHASASAFRSSLVSRIGAWAVDHPKERPLDFRRIFPDLHRTLVRSFYDERREAVTRVQRNVLLHGSPDFAALPDDDRALAETTLEGLRSRFGYCPACARDAVDLALRRVAQ